MRLIKKTMSRIMKIVLIMVMLVIGTIIVNRVVIPYAFSGYMYLATGITLRDPTTMGGYHYEKAATCYHDAEYDQESIYYRSSVGMYNGTSEAINFRLRGWAFLEYLYGIIDSPVVAAVDENGDEMEFYIDPGEELQLKNVVFRASRNQTTEKSLKVDRTLFPLYIIVEERK